MSWVTSLLRSIDLNDVVGVAGAGVLVHGVSQWSAPGAWVTAGALLLGVALWPHLTTRRS